MAAIFDFFILTAPSEKIAESYRPQLQLLRNSLPQLHHAEIYCVADPQGVRIGSGGGTLYALNEVAGICGQDRLRQGRVLLIHSGGDSRRAPLYSVCGKAWTSLNRVTNEGVVVNPLILLVQELSALCKDLTAGSLVVACSDVLLNFASERWLHDSMKLFQNNGVYVVTVEAPVGTAKNHGVLINHDLIHNINHNTASASEKLCEQCAVDLYLQKPSEAVMRSSGALFSASNEETSLACIDTGVVVFSHTSFLTLLSLLDIKITPSETKLRDQMIRFELYHELLCVCSTTQTKSESFEDYLQRIGIHGLDVNSTYRSLLFNLWQEFHAIPLHLLYVKGGSFRHLGTSKEVLELLSERDNEQTVSEVNSCIKSSTSLDATVIHSLVSMQSSSAKNAVGSLIEYSILNVHESQEMPQHSAISHLYSCFGDHIHYLPTHFLLQQVFLRPTAVEQSNNLSLLICLHVNDDVKASISSGTVFGRKWSDFLEAMNCRETDIWQEDAAEKTLWTAKLFPVVHIDRQRRLSCLLQENVWIGVEARDLLLGAAFHRGQGINNSTWWKSSHRLSLSEILAQSDATAMFVWKQLLSAAKEAFFEKENLSTWSVVDLIHLQWRQFHHNWHQHISLLKFASMIMLLQLREKFALAKTRNGIMEELKKDTALQLLFSDVYSIVDEKYSAFIDDYHVFLATVQQECEDDGFLPISKLISTFCRSFAEVDLQLCKTIAQYLLQLGDHIDMKNHPRLLLAVSWIFDHQNLSIDSSLLEPKHDEKLSLEISMQENFQWIRTKFESAFHSMTRVSAKETKSRDYFEMLTQRLVCLHIQWSLFQRTTNRLDNDSVNFEGFDKSVVAAEKVYLAQAPVRIDLAGGWSDTPPICYDQSGSVLNVAIQVDGKCPIRSVARFCKDKKLFFQCWKRLNEENAERESDIALAGEEVCSTVDDLLNLSLTQSSCALLKACFLALGFSRFIRDNGKIACLEEILTKYVGCGVQLSCFSDLPAGSGMGGSSILAAAILKSLAALFSHHLSNESLVYLVSEVEQLLTTGGGWQDQIGGCFPGFKIARSLSQLPLTVNVESIAAPLSFYEMFNRRVFLIYTGQQRLAKNTLINALRTFSVTASTCFELSQISTVRQLIENAESGYALLGSLQYGEINDEVAFSRLGAVLSRYWKLKIDMAPGSDPPHIRQILSIIEPFTCGLSLCGAGAGGFGAIMLKNGFTEQELRQAIDEINQQDAFQKSSNKISLHSVSIDQEGLKVSEHSCVDDSSPLALKRFLL